MNIGVIGVGMVGGACKYGFEKLGHKVKTFDTKFPNSSIQDTFYTDINFICVPTPANQDGSCNTSIVEKTVDDLYNLKYSGIIAIKSTVEPGLTEKLISKYSNIKICFVPEFLRERCAISDFVENNDLLAVGTHDDMVYKEVVKCHGKYPKSTTKLTPTEAEILKYYSNVFNALRVTFANEMYEVCNAIGASYDAVKDSFMKRKTATDMYMDVNENFRGYAGMCLTKDTKALASLVRKLQLNLNLFECIDQENAKFKPTVLEGMRLE